MERRWSHSAHFELYDDALPALDGGSRARAQDRAALELVARPRTSSSPITGSRPTRCSRRTRTGRRSRTSRSSARCSSCSTVEPAAGGDGRRHARRGHRGCAGGRDEGRAARPREAAPRDFAGRLDGSSRPRSRRSGCRTRAARCEADERLRARVRPLPRSATGTAGAVPASGEAIGAEKIGGSLYELRRRRAHLSVPFPSRDRGVADRAGGDADAARRGRRARAAGRATWSASRPGPEGAHQLRGPGDGADHLGEPFARGDRVPGQRQGGRLARRARSSASPTRSTTGTANDGGRQPLRRRAQARRGRSARLRGARMARFGPPDRRASARRDRSTSSVRGESICPYHYEYPEEEWLIVLDGAPDAPRSRTASTQLDARRPRLLPRGPRRRAQGDEPDRRPRPRRDALDEGQDVRSPSTPTATRSASGRRGDVASSSASTPPSTTTTASSDPSFPATCLGTVPRQWPLEPCPGTVPAVGVRLRHRRSQSAPGDCPRPCSKRTAPGDCPPDTA